MAVEGIKIGMNVIGYTLKLAGLIKDSTNAKLDEVFDQIRNVNKTIQDLHDETLKGFLHAAYAMPCERIQNGAKYLELIVRKHNVELYKDKIREICANDNMTSQLTALVNGILGEGDFRGNILETKYTLTHGHRSKLEEFCTGLLVLLVGGCSVIYYYETIQQGEENAKDFLEHIFQDKIKRAEKSIDDILERCKKEVKGNLEGDMKRYIDAHEDDDIDQKFVDKFFDEVKPKYDWLDLVVTAARKFFLVLPFVDAACFTHSRHKKSISVLYAEKNRRQVTPKDAILEVMKPGITATLFKTGELKLLTYRVPLLSVTMYYFLPFLGDMAYYKTELTMEKGFFVNYTLPFVFAPSISFFIVK